MTGADGFGDGNDDDSAQPATYQDAAVDKAVKAIEAAMDKELSIQHSAWLTNNWLTCFKTRLTSTALNIALAKMRKHLEVDAANALKNRLKALQQEVEANWESPEFRVDQMRSAVRRLAAIIAEIPFQ